MASIKVKFRPSTVMGKKGTVFYQITHKQRVKMISTEMKLTQHEWEQICRSICENDMNVNCQSVCRRIESDMLRFNEVVKIHESMSEGFTIDDICDMFINNRNGKGYVLQYVQDYADNLEQQGRWGQVTICNRM